MLFQFFSFNSNSAWPDNHFGVLHDHIRAFIGAWDAPNNPNISKSSKMGSFLHGYHGYGKYFLIFSLSQLSLKRISANAITFSGMTLLALLFKSN